MRARVAIFGTFGALATAVAALLVVAPDLATLPAVRKPIENLTARDPRSLMLAGTAAVGLYAVLAARSPGGSRRLGPVSAGDENFEAAVDDPPEAVTDDRRQLTAHGLDEDIDAAISEGGVRLKRTRETLFQTAASAYAHHGRVSPKEAQVAIETGTWTDDDLAAAFLASDDGPRPGTYSRIRLWLLPAAERERRIERTVAAIRHLQEGLQ